MNLKPMDENTLAFLKTVVIEWEDTLSQAATGTHARGWLQGNEAIIRLAIASFTDSDDPNYEYIPDFMEAIKNADTDQ